jgi:tetratricopeptide (TPR) repeat protein
MAEISNAFNIIDTAMIFNSAYCFDQCGKFDLAVKGYNECIKYSYNVPDTYRYLSDVYTRNNQKEEARKVLSDARAKFPNDADLLTAEVNILLGNQEYVKAEELLVALTQKDGSNEMYWYVLGVTYDKLAKKAEEEKAYLKAIELKPNYYDARFNLGALFFNQGVEKDTQCNDIPPRETAKYNDCVAQASVLFKKSVEHLEAAYNNIPENLKGTQEEKQLITALKDAYYKAGQEADYQRMKDLLGNSEEMISESSSNYGGAVKGVKTIQMKKMESGVYEIPCKINGLDLSCVFDTGASDVSISLTEALFMLKHGHLTESDIKGSASYSIARLI